MSVHRVRLLPGFLIFSWTRVISLSTCFKLTLSTGLATEDPPELKNMRRSTTQQTTATPTGLTLTDPPRFIAVARLNSGLDAFTSKSSSSVRDM